MIRRYLKYYLIFFFLILVYYHKIFWTYFQGDEWHFFSEYLPLFNKPWGFILAISKAFVDPVGPHFTPLLNFIHYFEFKFLRLNYNLYAFLSLMLHAFNSLLLFIFVYTLTKNNRIAWIAALFFALSAVHYQAVSWMGTYLNSELTAGFILISLINYSIFFFKGKNKNIWISAFFLFIALLIKETAAFLFIIYPLLFYFLTGKNIKQFINQLKPIFMTAILYFILYLSPKLLTILNFAKPYPGRSFVWMGLPLLMFRILIYPVRALAEVYFPPGIIFFLAEKLAVLAYPPYGQEAKVRGSNFLTFVQGAGSDTFIFLISFLLILVFFWLRKELIIKKKNNFVYSFWIGLLIVLTSVLPLIFIGLNKSLSWWGYSVILDSRHLYPASIGAGILIALFFYLIEQKKSLKIANSLLILLFIFYYFNLSSRLNNDVEMGKDRRKIMHAIKQKYSQLPPTTAFYAGSNRSYYGFAELMFPFQINFGRTILISYAFDQNIPEDAITGNYWKKLGLAEGGYADYGDFKFGYFVDKKNLKAAIESGKFLPEDVIAYFWDGEKKTITDNTAEIRKEMIAFWENSKLFSNWKTYNNNKANFKFRYPLDSKLIIKEDEIGGQTLDKLVVRQGNIYNGSEFGLTVLQKPEVMGVSNLVYYLEDSDGRQIRDNFTFKSIKFNNGDVKTAVISQTGRYPKYFFNLKSNTTVFAIMIKSWGNRVEYANNAKQIFSFIENIEK